MMRLVSYLPEYSSEIFKQEIFEKLIPTLNLLIHCPDNQVKKAIGNLIAHIIIVHVKYFDIELDHDFTIDSKELIDQGLDEDFFEDRGMVIMNFLSKLLSYVMFSDTKKTPYKKLEHFFKLWVSLATHNRNINLWLIGKAGCIRKFIGKPFL